MEEGLMTWEELKKRGSDHYKTGEIEPIDLYRSAGMLRHYTITSIIRYAYRNGYPGNPKFLQDMEKIKHCVDLLLIDEKSKETKEDQDDLIFNH